MNIVQDLINYFKEQAGTDVSVDTPLVEDGVIDSMGVMKLIEFIESTYGVGLDMDDLTIENFASINHIKDFITSKKEDR